MLMSRSANILSAEQKPSFADETTNAHPAHGGRWMPFASFVIEFQVQIVAGHVPAERIKVHHIEADVCATWATITHSSLCQWLLTQLKIDSA